MKNIYICIFVRCILITCLTTFLFVSCNSESDDAPCLGDLCAGTSVDGKPDDLRGSLQLIKDWLPGNWTGTAYNGDSYDLAFSYDPVCPYAGETFSVSFDSFSELDCGNDSCDSAQSGTFTFLTHVQIGAAIFTLNGSARVVEPETWSIYLGEATPQSGEVGTADMQPFNTDDSYYSPSDEVGDWYLVLKSGDTSDETDDVCLLQQEEKK